MVMIVIDLVSRGIYHPIIGLDAVAVFILIFISYIGLGYCEQVKSHVRVSILMSKLPPRWNKLLDQFDYFLAFSAGSVAVYAAGLSALWAFVHSEAVAGPLELPVFPIKFALTFGLVLYLLQLLVSLMGLFKREGEGGAKRILY